MMKKYGACLVLAAVLALSACTSVKKEMGVGRNSPDEFLVVKRAPLTLPPDYGLRPPVNPNDAPPASAAAAASAEEIILGKSTDEASIGSPEKELLRKIGADAANPDIRKQIDEDNGYISLQNKTVAEKLIFWNDDQSAPQNMPDSVVNAGAEAERIKKAKAEGTPVTGAAVPVIEKKKSTLDKIF